MKPSYQIIISPEAAADLEAIYEYIAHDSPRNAAILVERILNAIEPLGSFPHRTVTATNPNITRAVRSLPVQPYVFFSAWTIPAKSSAFSRSAMEPVENQSDLNSRR
jgi:plasmid stabilization system protein ParE